MRFAMLLPLLFVSGHAWGYADWDPQNPFGSLIRCDQTYDLAEISLNPFLRKRTVWIGPEGENADGGRTVWMRSLGRDDPVLYDEDPRQMSGLDVSMARCERLDEASEMLVCTWDGKELRLRQQVFEARVLPFALEGQGRGFQLFRASTFQCLFPRRRLD